MINYIFKGTKERSFNMPKQKKPPLPPLLNRKISKTGQTRGADDDEIYQNRVNRCNTALIPYHQWISDQTLRNNCNMFEKGYIVLISPSDYFSYKDPVVILNIKLLYFSKSLPRIFLRPKFKTESRPLIISLFTKSLFTIRISAASRTV
jgi:hypothetical protein